MTGIGLLVRQNGNILTMLNLSIHLRMLLANLQFSILAASTPHSILIHLMEERGLRQTDLVGIIGSRGVVSEVVNGKRPISNAQAKSLGNFFYVDPSLFVNL